MKTTDPQPGTGPPEAPLGAHGAESTPWLPRSLILFGAGMLVLGLWAGVQLVRQDATASRPRPQRWISLEEAETPDQSAPLADAEDTVSLRVAIAPVLSPEYSLGTYDAFVRYLAKKLGRRPYQVHGKNYSEVNDMVRNGQCDLALVCDFAFVRGEQSFGMEALASPVVKGEVVYYSLIVVQPSLRATSLPDLRGRRFASSDLLSASGWLYPVVWLKERGENPNRFFKQHLITGSHDRSVQAVASGYVDAAAVDSLVFEDMVERDPSVAQAVKVVAKSPSLGMPPMAVHPALDRDLRSRLLTVLLEMHEDQDGKRALGLLRIDRFVVPEKSAFDGVRSWAAVLDSRP